MNPGQADSPLPDFERCRVVEQLASGPVTNLYRAEQSPLGRPVLIKALSPSVVPTSPFAATLEREASLLAELDHDNIVRLYDFVRRADTMWLVLESLDGYRLSDVIARCTRLPPRAAAAIALQVARALEHAHNSDIVHREVQPRNIFVCRNGRVKLMNFAAATDNRLPTAPELLEGGGFGTPFYMSPEQVLGEPSEPRSDLFSLGVVLYEMLSGRRPFDAPDSRAATQRIRHDPPRPLGRAAAGIPPSLERVVQRCLQKMPSDRFFSAADLGRALESVLGVAAAEPEATVAAELSVAGLDAAARRDSGQRRPVSVSRRAPTLRAAALGLLICLFLLVAGGALIQYYATRRGNDPQRSGAPLELVPTDTAYLRVVADPWAHVVVDGQRVDTTPFARPIPLSPGVHYVRLEHPSAPIERRTVRLSPGETVLLDVKMDVSRARASAEPALPPAVAETP